MTHKQIIIFDINHPAHFHFFRNPAKLLENDGHEIIFTSRKKDVTIDLFEQHNVPHVLLSTMGKRGLASLGTELIQRNYALWKVCRKFKPDIMAAIGGTFVAQTGFISRVPSLVFYDTENAKLQNFITYPFATEVIVPKCYSGWLPKSHDTYAGYHELSYLHPSYFTPNKNIALSCGLSKQNKTMLIRLVSWQANHDIGEKGWNSSLLEDIINRYKTNFEIIISSEDKIDNKFSRYAYKGKPHHIHHLLAHCSIFVGESATMASEAVTLGVPAVYAAETSRGYIDYQEQFGLTKIVRNSRFDSLSGAIDQLTSLDHHTIKKRHSTLLQNQTDVPQYIANKINSYLNQLKRNRSHNA